MVHEAAQLSLALGEQDDRTTLIYIRDLVQKMANSGQRTLILISPGFYAGIPGTRPLESQAIEAAARANVTISTLDARGLYTTVRRPMMTSPVTRTKRRNGYDPTWNR